MSLNMTRRDFLEVIFTTVPAVALSNPLDALWPEEKKDLPVAEPFVMEIDSSGYLFDPDHELQLPSVREVSDFDDMSWKEQIYFWRDRLGEEELLEFYERPLWTWTRRDVDEFSACHANILDADSDWEELGPWEQMHYSQYWPGKALVDELDNHQLHQLELRLVEGEHPGSSFCAVKYTGRDVEGLNQNLLQAGLNLIIRPCCIV